MSAEKAHSTASDPSSASPGKILLGNHNGVYVVRLEGDVRLNLCMPLEGFISDMFAAKDFRAVLFDLESARGIDSTSLGLLAKIALFTRDKGAARPVVVGADPGMCRLLDSMGFEDLMDYGEGLVAAPVIPQVTEEVLAEPQDEEATRQVVLDAHRVLMSLNEKNRETFRDLVASLEQCSLKP